MRNENRKLLVEFAHSHSMTPKEAHVLPALFDKVAEKSDQTLRQAIVNTIKCREYSDYLAKVAKQIASTI